MKLRRMTCLGQLARKGKLSNAQNWSDFLKETDNPEDPVVNKECY